MSDIKEVKVSLSNNDEKLLVPGARKRTRRVKRSDPDQGPVEKIPDTELGQEKKTAPSGVMDMEQAQAQAQAKQQPVVPEPTKATVSLPLPALSTASETPVVPTVHVKIQDKKRNTVPIQQPMKILPKKKFVGGGSSSGPSKKPNFIVSNTQEKKDTVAKTYKKRRFGNRKISIEMAPLSKTRNHRRELKKKITAMTKDEVYSQLKEKGILTSKKATSLPEDTMRGLLREYLLLHAAE